MAGETNAQPPGGSAPVRGLRHTVLVVDDDEAYRARIEAALESAGYAICAAGSSAEARAILRETEPSVCVVDLMMPGVTGKVLCQEISETTRAGIIVASSLDAVDERIRLLSFGADDYIVKPFDPRELVARISALIRRLGRDMPAPAAETVSYAGWRYSFANRRVIFDDGRSVALTPGENRVLDYLTRNAGLVVTREDLLAVSRTRQHAGQADRSVDMLVSRLRAKIEPDPANPALLRTVWGRGYVFGDQ